MENNQDFEILQKQIENNITDWYPFEENVKYYILKDFSKDKIKELENVVESLTENSKILILLSNKLAFQNIDDENKLFSRKEIENLLDKYGLNYRKFYYPLPNYKMTNVIFTDSHLPDDETISRSITFYKDNEIKKNDERIEFRKILNQDNNLFKIFANSFFIECSNKRFEDNGIEFVSFSNMRKEEYRIKTIIKGDSVYKQAANKQAINHIEQIKRNIDILKEIKLNTLDKYDNLGIISEYQRNKKTMDRIIIDLLKNGQVDEVQQIIYELFQELKEKLVISQADSNVFDKYNIKYEKEDINNLTFVKYGLWDLIFQNIFYIDNKYYFYDQEWIEENLPLEFIIYRALTYNQELEMFLDKNEIYNKFNINTKNIELFVQLDNKLQEKTRSELSWKLHTNYLDINKIKQIIDNLKEEKEKITQDCIKLLNEKDSRIKFLEDNMEQTCNLLKQKEQEIALIKNSTSWKVTAPFRKLRGEK